MKNKLDFSVSLLRCLVLAVFGLVASGDGFAQSVDTAAPGSVPSRAEISAAYSFFSPFGSDINLHNYESIHAGAVIDATFYFNRRYGIQGEGSIFPKGPTDNNCVNSAMIGPVIRTRRGHFSPFLHILAGAAQAGGPVNQLCSVWGWGLTTGFGVDYKTSFLPQRLAIRPIQFDYTYSHIDNGPLSSNGYAGGLGKVYAFRFSSGITVRLDGSHFVRPTLVCAANPEIAFAGGPITVSGNVLNARSSGADHFTWKTAAGSIVPDGATAALDTAGLHPGMYRVTGTYYQGNDARHSSLCTAQFQIREPSPPMVACSADRTTLTQGEDVLIHANGNSPNGRPLTYTYATSDGNKLAGTGDQATLTTAMEPPGRLQVTCTATDDLGQNASAVTSIDLLPRPLVAEVRPPTPPSVPTPAPEAAPTPAPTPVPAPPPAPAPVPRAAPSRPAPRPRSMPPAQASKPVPQPVPPPAPLVPATPNTPQVQRMCTLTFPADPIFTTVLSTPARSCLDRAVALLRRDNLSTLSLSGGYAPGEVNGRAVERILSASDYLTKVSGVQPGRLHMRLAPHRTRSLIVAVVPDRTPPRYHHRRRTGH